MASVVLHGELAEKFASSYNLDVDSPKDALKALCSLVPNFKNTFKQGRYYLYLQKENDILEIDEDNFNFHSNYEIHIMPEISGAKSGLTKALMGIALIGLTFIPGVGAFAAGEVMAVTGATEAGATLAVGIASLGMHAIATLGIAMALGGAAQMLAPKTKPTNKIQNYTFNASDLNIQNGAAVPLIYGEVLAAGLVISSEISNVDMQVPNDPTYNANTGSWNRIDYQVYETP